MAVRKREHHRNRQGEKKGMSNGFDYPWVKKDPEQLNNENPKETPDQATQRKKEELKRLLEKHGKGLHALKSLKETIDYLSDDLDAIYEVTDRANIGQKEFIKLKAAHYELYKYVVRLKEQIDDYGELSNE